MPTAMARTPLATTPQPPTPTIVNTINSECSTAMITIPPADGSDITKILQNTDEMVKNQPPTPWQYGCSYTVPISIPALKTSSTTSKTTRASPYSLTKTSSPFSATQTTIKWPQGFTTTGKIFRPPEDKSIIIKKGKSIPLVDFIEKSMLQQQKTFRKEMQESNDMIGKRFDEIISRMDRLEKGQQETTDLINQLLIAVSPK